MHLCLGAASAVVSALLSPDRAAEVFLCARRLGQRDDPLGGLPRLGVLARRDDGTGAPVGDGVMALARYVGTTCGDQPDLHVGEDLAEQLG